jgi:Phosphoesterase family
VVILMQENRSFDHYFGTLSGVRGFSDPNILTQVFDTWPTRHDSWNGGAMDKFVATHVSVDGAGAATCARSCSTTPRCCASSRPGSASRCRTCRPGGAA